MNKVNYDVDEPIVYRQGDFFRDGDGIIYILAMVDVYEYCLICLSDGMRWSDPNRSIEKTVKGCHFIGRDLKITISES